MYQIQTRHHPRAPTNMLSMFLSSIVAFGLYMKKHIVMILTILPSARLHTLCMHSVGAFLKQTGVALKKKSSFILLADRLLLMYTE